VFGLSLTFILLVFNYCVNDIAKYNGSLLLYSEDITIILLNYVFCYVAFANSITI